MPMGRRPQAPGLVAALAPGMARPARPEAWLASQPGPLAASCSQGLPHYAGQGRLPGPGTGARLPCPGRVVRAPAADPAAGAQLAGACQLPPRRLVLSWQPRHGHWRPARYRGLASVACRGAGQLCTAALPRLPPPVPASGHRWLATAVAGRGAPGLYGPAACAAGASCWLRQLQARPPAASGCGWPRAEGPPVQAGGTAALLVPAGHCCPRAGGPGSWVRGYSRLRPQAWAARATPTAVPLR